VATNFPTSLDTYTTKTDNVDDVMASHINDLQDAVEALEAKVGIDGSGVATSHDYKISQLEDKVKKYDSGWFACVSGGTYTKTHNLGSVALMAQILFAPDDGGSPDLTKVKIEQWHHDGGVEKGAQIIDITTTQLTVQAGNNRVAYYPDSNGNDVTQYGSGHYRVLAFRMD